jgi:hypothetical protein
LIIVDCRRDRHGFDGEELMEVKTVEVNDGTVEGLLVIAELEMPASLSRRWVSD